MQQFAVFPENYRMKTIAYFIDPLLEAPENTLENGFLETLVPLFNRLPEYRHIVLTGFADISWEENTPDRPELVVLEARSSLFISRTQRLKNSLKIWLDKEQPAVLVSFDKDMIADFSGKTALISSADNLLKDHKGRAWKKRPEKLPAWLAAQMISVPFEEDRQAILGFFPQLADTIRVQYPALQPPCPTISWSEQETLKIRHSGGRDYFLYAGPLHAEESMIHLLKAYSQLKKWLMTGMPLLLAGPSTESTGRLQELLKTYKYRADITVLADIDPMELQVLLAGTYLLNYPFQPGYPTWPLEWAISSGTPLVTTQHPLTNEICRTGAAYAAAGDIDAWAHQMMVLYKDETLRSKLIEKEQERYQELNQSLTLDRYAALLRQLSA